MTSNPAFYIYTLKVRAYKLKIARCYKNCCLAALDLIMTRIPALSLHMQKGTASSIKAILHKQKQMPSTKHQNSSRYKKHFCGQKGWEFCKDYVVENAFFEAQSDAFADVDKIRVYTDAMAGLANVTMPGSSYKIHSSAFMR